MLSVIMLSVAAPLKGLTGTNTLAYFCVEKGFIAGPKIHFDNALNSKYEYWKIFIGFSSSRSLHHTKGAATLSITTISITTLSVLG
jgi:hypothetical protein